MLTQVQEYISKLEKERKVTMKDVEEQAAKEAEEAKANGDSKDEDEDAWEDEDEEMS